MRARQRKSGQAVIERCRVPSSCGVAVGAIGRGKDRTRCRVHRIVRFLPGRQVALRVATVG